MLRNYFSFIAVYKRINSRKDLCRLSKDEIEGRWIVVKKKRWLSHKGWLFTVYRGQITGHSKGRITSMVGHTKNDVYKGGGDGSTMVPATKGLAGTLSEDFGEKNTLIFLWDPKYALQKEATKPVFNEKTIRLIQTYLW